MLTPSTLPFIFRLLENIHNLNHTLFFFWICYLSFLIPPWGGTFHALKFSPKIIKMREKEREKNVANGMPNRPGSYLKLWMFLFELYDASCFCPSLLSLSYLSSLYSIYILISLSTFFYISTPLLCTLYCFYSSLILYLPLLSVFYTLLSPVFCVPPSVSPHIIRAFLLHVEICFSFYIKWTPFVFVPHLFLQSFSVVSLPT